VRRPLAELENVSFGYRKGDPILQGFDARFYAANVCAVTGPSGCGKSTALSILGLLLSPMSGRVAILGCDYSSAPDATRAAARREHIGFVFQDALLETSMTVWQNLSESLPPGFSRRAARSRAAVLIASLALPDDILDRKAIGLSGGQAQRVAVARALLKEPRIVLADEPTGNLDAVSGSIVLDTLFSYAYDNDRTCVVVTHDPEIVNRADSSIRMVGTCA
jgi:ABC-type lipoprotein export system ATPase subunit